ncbi:MAG: hypothetical protein NVSMB2_12870 [Chloroflexota bacterium]
MLLLAALVRFWHLGGMPVLFFDSGAYMGEGRFLASAAQRAVDAVVHAAPGTPGDPIARAVKAVELGTAGHPPDLAKPGQSILLGMSMLVFGPTTFAAGLVPALAGVGTIAATYGIGSVAWNQRTGLVAAFLLTISAEHLVYSREPLVESTGLVFATVAALVYMRRLVQPQRLRSAGTLFVVGCLVGLAFACNNRLLYLSGPFGLMEIMVWWRDGGLRYWRPLLTSLVALGFGFLFPLALTEGAFLAAQAIGHAYGAQPQFLDYAHQFVNFMRMNPASRSRIDQWPTFFADLALMDGLPVLAFFLVGLVYLVARRRSWSHPVVFTTVSLLVPLVLFSVYSSGEVRMRNFSVALPWTMLVAAVGLCRLAERTRCAPALVAAGCAILSALALPRAISIVTAPSATPALVARLADIGIERVASTNGPVLSYYIGEDHTNARLRTAFINTEADFQQIAVDYPFVVLDMQGYWAPGPLPERAPRVTPVFQAPNGSDTLFLADLLERHGMAWGQWTDVLGEWTANHAAATLMRLYRSADLVAS